MSNPFLNNPMAIQNIRNFPKLSNLPLKNSQKMDVIQYAPTTKVL